MSRRTNTRRCNASGDAVDDDVIKMADTCIDERMDNEVLDETNVVHRPQDVIYRKRGVNSDGQTLETRMQTLVAFVLDEKESEWSATRKMYLDDDDRDSGDSPPVVYLLSMLYCLCLVLTGIAMPCMEALTGEWQTNDVTGCFLAYIFVVSTAFLIYVQCGKIYDEINTKRKNKKIISDMTRNPSNLENKRNTKTKTNPDIVVTRVCKQFVPARESSVDTISMSPGKSETMRPETMRQDNFGPRIHLTPDQSSASAKHQQISELSVRTLSLAGLSYQRHSDGFSTKQSDDMLGIEQNPVTSRKRDSGETHLSTYPPAGSSGPHRQNHMECMDVSQEKGSNCKGESIDIEAISTDGGFENGSEEIYERVILTEQTASLGPEEASFYLRLGSLLFGVGNFIFVAMELQARINCPSSEQRVYPWIFQMVFLLVQTFFLFKNTSIHVKRHASLIRFGILHVLATNLCIWFRVLLREVAEVFGVEVENLQPGPFSDEIGHVETNDTCVSQLILLEEATPYLYPFVLEYSLIAMATMAGMYPALNLVVSIDIIKSVKEAIRRKPPGEDISASPHPEEEFFSKSHRGLFMGMLLLSGTIISIIMFFFNLRRQELHINALTIYYSTDIVIHGLLIAVLVVAINNFRHLKFTYDRDNTIDVVLLLISLSGLLLLMAFTSFCSVFYLYHRDLDIGDDTILALTLGAALLNAIQALLQTCFVIDGLHRCAADANQERKKPGRGYVTFMIISNVAIWVFKTLQVKEADLSNMTEFYGLIAWTFIINLNLPLLLFFRFHSSVCLADLWYSAYKRDNESRYKAL